MPQIWMTYQELADMLDCEVQDVRLHVHRECLDRKLSRDGKTRIKLDGPLIALFLERLRALHGAIATNEDRGISLRQLISKDSIPIPSSLMAKS